MKLSASIRVKDTSIKDKHILLATKNINLPSTLANKSIYLGDSILKGELEKFYLTGLIENSTNKGNPTYPRPSIAILLSFKC